MTAKDEKILSAFGIIGPLFIIIFTIIAVLLALPWFSWLHSHLSDLGNPVMILGSEGIPGDNPAAFFFNGALALGGLALVLFSLRLILESRRMPDSVKDRALHASLLFGIGMIFLMLVGVYNSSYPGPVGPHVIVALIFFIFLFVSTALFSTIFLKKKETRPIGILQVITLIVSIGVWIVTFSSISPWTANAIPETVSIMLTVLWVIFLAYRLYQEKAIA